VFLFVFLYLRGSPAVSTSSTKAAGNAKTELRVTERDVVALGIVTQQVAELATLPGFDELSKTAARIGATYFTLLEQVAAAEEIEDGGHALRQLDVSQHHLSSVADALRRAADVSYTKLKRMLLREPKAELAMAPTSLVRTTYGWMLGDLFLYSVVLPEYYLLRDDTPSHAVVLLRSLNLLSWSPVVHTVPIPNAAGAQTSNMATLTAYDIFNWSGGAACRKGPLGTVSTQWMQFCESSFSSSAAVARRVAATYEELIVLYPDYAPLRLHYAVAFTFLSPVVADGTASSLSDHAMKALRVIRNDGEKLLRHHYKEIDALHMAVLRLLEAYLTPIEMWTAERETQLIHALHELKDCTHVRTSLLASSFWAGNGAFVTEYRVPVLTVEQLTALLTKTRVHLGADHVALTPFYECL
jgi:hypothetical protein